METSKKVNKYYLPHFAKLSDGICILGVIFLTLFLSLVIIPMFLNEEESRNNIIFSFARGKGVNYTPIIFIFLSYAMKELGALGLQFSRRGYLAAISKKEDKIELINFDINYVFFFIFMPIVTISFDKNISAGNMMYITAAGLLYIFVICYSSLLLWYKNKFKKYIITNQ